MSRSRPAYALLSGLAALAVAITVVPSAQAATPLGASTQSEDTTPPTAPTNLSFSATCSGVVPFTWTAATDNVAVTAYEVFREVSTNNFALARRDHHHDRLRYQVRVRDAAGNASPFSAPVIPVPPPCPPPDTRPG